MPVALVIGQLAGGETAEALMTECGITKDDILAALAYAASFLADSEVRPIGGKSLRGNARVR